MSDARVMVVAKTPDTPPANCDRPVGDDSQMMFERYQQTQQERSGDFLLAPNTMLGDTTLVSETPRLREVPPTPGTPIQDAAVAALPPATDASNGPIRTTSSAAGHTRNETSSSFPSGSPHRTAAPLPGAEPLDPTVIVSSVLTASASASDSAPASAHVLHTRYEEETQEEPLPPMKRTKLSANGRQDVGKQLTIPQESTTYTSAPAVCVGDSVYVKAESNERRLAKVCAVGAGKARLRYYATSPGVMQAAEAVTGTAAQWARSVDVLLSLDEEEVLLEQLDLSTHVTVLTPATRRHVFLCDTELVKPPGETTVLQKAA